MTRLTWRLARPNILSSAILLALVALFAVLTHRAITGYLHDSGVNTCMAGGGDCSDLVDSFYLKFNSVIGVTGWLNLVPMLAGVFWGAPLIARELEEGTHRTVWTQSVSRGRWLATKLPVFLAGALIVAAVMTALMTWWFKPLEALHSRHMDDGGYARITPNVFDFRGLVPVACTVLAFAIGAAAGTFFKRSLVAVVVTVVTYIPLKVGLQSLRAHYLPPVKLYYPFGTDSPRGTAGDWILSHNLIDKTGQAITKLEIPAACRAFTDRGKADACTAAQGYRFLDVYQPGSRFWPLQFIETGIMLALSALLLGAAAWWIIRKVS
jgi:hypothetical protein